MADYIAINGVQITRPPELTPKIEDVYAGDYVTCTGKVIADKIGWKYSDMTLEWDALPQSEVDVLIGMNGACTLTFESMSGLVTENVIRTSAVSLQHRRTVRGEVWWKKVSVEVKFINVHTD